MTVPNPFGVKFCGFTRAADVESAVRLSGLTHIGLIFAPASPRCLTAAQATPLSQAARGRAIRVGVFQNQPAETIAAMAKAVDLDWVQLHGDEAPDLCQRLSQHWPVIKAFAADPPFEALAAQIATYAPFIRVALIDRPKGSPVPVDQWHHALADWHTAHPLPVAWWLAGGLTPANVSAYVRQARPDGVDVASGIETDGVFKDSQKMHAFLTALSPSH